MRTLLLHSPTSPAPCRRPPPPFSLALVAALALAGLPAQAEKADRFKPLNVEADLPGKIDLLNQFVVFNGNVVVTKGTMTIRAARIEVRELPDGYHTAVAFGSPTQHATFRQKRDAPDEYIAGDAERLEYDGKSDTIRFVNSASVRRLRGARPPTRSAATWSPTTAAPRSSTSPAARRRRRRNPGSRVRAVLTPQGRQRRRRRSGARGERGREHAAQLRTAPALGDKP